MHLVSTDCMSSTVVTGEAGDMLLHALASDAHSGSSRCLNMHVTPIMRTTSTSECLPRIRDCHKRLVAISFYPHTLPQVAGIRMRKWTHRAKDSAQSDGEGGATGTRHSCASLCSQPPPFPQSC